MHYVLYRKYRPMTFSDVIGQEHITKTLKRQITDLSFSHAYLFTGTRGTGKTTCAQIFSRAVNCLNPKDGEPCNECDVCRGIIDGGIYDITEMDAASNNGVDDIRVLRDEVAFSPVVAKYKVYIIDEAHMLSNAACNALLKTLEEPPEYVIFILATTDPQKLPATVLSRCQRFDFNRLSIKTIEKHLEKILNLEGKALDSDILYTIADAADGSARDAMSILEKAIEVSAPSELEKILGMTARSTLYSLIENALNHDVKAIFETVAELYGKSADLSVLIKNLLSVFREILIAKSVPDCGKLLDKRPEDVEKLVFLADHMTEDYIVYSLSTLRQTAASLTYSADRRADTELCLLKLAKPSLSGDYESLAVRLELLENKIASGTFAVNRRETERTIPKVLETEREIPTAAEEEPKKQEALSKEIPPEPKPETVKTDPEPSVSEPEPVLPEPEKTAPNQEKSDKSWRELASWTDIAGSISAKDMLLSLMLSQSCRTVCRGHEAVILCPEKQIYDNAVANMETIKQAFEKNKRCGYTVKAVVCKDITEYINETDTYDQAENSGLFDFGN